jgi:hypothetical protein
VRRATGCEDEEAADADDEVVLGEVGKLFVQELAGVGVEEEESIPTRVLLFQNNYKLSCGNQFNKFHIT